MKFGRVPFLNTSKNSKTYLYVYDISETDLPKDTYEILFWVWTFSQIFTCEQL